MLLENVCFFGVWTIKSENIKTGEVKELVFKNAITQGYFTAIHRFLSEDQLTVTNDELNITHLGIGDGITPALRTDSTLENEIERLTVTTKSFTDSKYSIKIFIDAGDGNLPGGFIKELGIFTKATATLDSGNMISRSIVNVQKNSNIRLTLNWGLSDV
jgi:hypothetical protein